MVGPSVAWASGADGTCLRTVDGGDHWERLQVPDGSRLDFRDVHAFTADHACLLSIGPGEQSRIYATTDGGRSWVASFINRDPRGFLDAIAFWDDRRGIAMGDPVDGRFMILRTDDAGKSWAPIAPEGMPLALAKEGAFAASGTCLAVQGDRNAWFGTGGAATSRVFRSVDGGRTWTVHETPLPADSPSKGIFSLAFRDADHGIAVGGDYRNAVQPAPNLIKTIDGGRTWSLIAKEPGLSFRSAIVSLPGASPFAWVTVGPEGGEVSRDDGETWIPLNLRGFHAADFRSSHSLGWAVGEGGTIARFNLNEMTRP